MDDYSSDGSESLESLDDLLDELDASNEKLRDRLAKSNNQENTPPVSAYQKKNLENRKRNEERLRKLGFGTNMEAAKKKLSDSCRIIQEAVTAAGSDDVTVHSESSIIQGCFHGVPCDKKHAARYDRCRYTAEDNAQYFNETGDLHEVKCGDCSKIFSNTMQGPKYIKPSNKNPVFCCNGRNTMNCKHCLCPPCLAAGKKTHSLNNQRSLRCVQKN